MRRRVRAFVGYQFLSEYRTEEGIKSLVGKLTARLDQKGVDLKVEYGRFPAGDLLWSAVVNAVRHSDVGIFDISENNPNVLIEVGLAAGFLKRLLLLKQEGSAKRYPKPADLGHIYVSFPKSGAIDDDGVVVELERGILAQVTAEGDPERIARSLWGLDEAESEDVVAACSELEDPEKLQHPEPMEFIYLSKYGDLDALMEVETTLHELFPLASVEHRTGNEMIAARRASAYTRNLVIVGGPDYNMLAKHFENVCPVDYSPAGPDNNISLRVKSTGEILTPKTRPEDPNHIVDYGFYAKLPNPYNPKSKLIMIGGAHTYGVYGAIRAFSFSRRSPDLVARSNCLRVIERFGADPSFVAVLEVHGIGSSIPTPKVDDRRLWSGDVAT